MEPFRRSAGLSIIAALTVLAGWGAAAAPAGATALPEAPTLHAGITWGACGSWWTETATRTESGSVCGVDGLVTDNGQPTQLAEPLITVSRYSCPKRGGDCREQSWTGTVRRSEMTVDPFLRRASIRGTLGGCVLDVEFAGLGPVRPDGNLWESHGLDGATPALGLGASQTFTSQASWWGGVCGETIVPSAGEEGRQAWMYRSVEATAGRFGGDGHGGCAAAAFPGLARRAEPATAC